MMSTADELKQKTLAYWKLSQIWNGRRRVNIGAESALKICNKIIDMTSTTRPLTHLTQGLKAELIKGEGTKKSKCKVISLKRKEVGASA